MTKKQIRLSDSETRMVRQLRERPELRKRFREVFEIVETRAGAPKKADEVESLLVEAARALGREAMESWARGAEQEAGRRVKEEDPALHVSKKKR